MIGESVSWKRRIPHAAYILIMNAFVWVLLPSLIYSNLSSVINYTNLPVNLTFIYTFGAIITGLQLLGAITEGMPVSMPFTTGGYLASAFYTYYALNGGSITVNQSGITITLFFPLLVFLMILPSIFNVVKNVLGFLLERTEVSRLYPDTV